MNFKVESDPEGACGKAEEKVLPDWPEHTITWQGELECSGLKPLQSVGVQVPMLSPKGRERALSGVSIAC